MHNVEPTRLSSLLVNEVQIKATAGGLEVHVEGVLRSGDLLGPPGTVYFNWDRFPPEVMELVRQLIDKVEEHVAQSLGGTPKLVAADKETAREEDGQLLPTLDELSEEDPEIPDLASFTKDLSQL